MEIHSELFRVAFPAEEVCQVVFADLGWQELMQAMGQSVPKSKRILEVNPNHPILERLQARFDADQADATISDYAKLLHGQALLAEGGKLENPAAFSALVSDLMTKALG